MADLERTQGGIFIARLRGARLRAGLTFNELARWMDGPIASFKLYETGRVSAPFARTVVKYEKHLALLEKAIQDAIFPLPRNVLKAKARGNLVEKILNAYTSDAPTPARVAEYWMAQLGISRAGKTETRRQAVVEARMVRRARHPRQSRTIPE